MGERFFTVGAWKRCLARVSQFVSLQVTGLGEGLGTSIAREEFLSGMASFMQLQFTRSWESFVTDWAVKRSLSGVSAAVNLQFTGSWEDFLTYLTVELHGPQWSGMYYLVSRLGCLSLNMMTKKWTKWMTSGCVVLPSGRHVLLWKPFKSPGTYSLSHDVTDINSRRFFWKASHLPWAGLTSYCQTGLIRNETLSSRQQVER